MRLAALAGSALLNLLLAGAAVSAPLERNDLEAWLDGLVPSAMQSGDIAGAVVVVVKDGEVLLQKGYGYADVAAKKPVDPERTLFRTGSVGKLVTDTAVMQLAELGKIDLDADINTYLDFKVPSLGRPVTMRDLLQHTGGFEEMVRGLVRNDAQQFEGLERYVKNTRPQPMFAPGQVPSYCNYCLALAGYVVQRVSGENFDDYVDRHVFQPLGMRRSTFRQPLPNAWLADLSKSYREASGPAQYFELLGPTPAGSLTATGADMGRFMLAHLQADSAAEPVLLRPETAQVMHTSMFSAVPPTQGNSLGFFDRSRNGRRIIGHGGDTQFFHSDLLLFMDDGVGLYMSFNSQGKEGATYHLREALFARFTDRYFPAAVPDEPALATAVEHSRAVAGVYAGSRRSTSTFFNVVSLLGQTRVIAKADGTLVVPQLVGLNRQPKVWREVEPYVWREVGGQERLAARVEDGKVRFVAFDSAGGIAVLMPVAGAQSSAWINPLMLAAIGVLLASVVAWPIAALVRRRYHVAFDLSGRQAAAHHLTRVVALVGLCFLLGWALLIQGGLSDLAAFGGRMDGFVALLHVVGVFCIVGVGVAIWHARLTFGGSARWWSKAWSLALVAAVGAIAWFGLAFNLVGWQVRY